MRRAFAAAVLLTMLAACGGGSGPSPTAPVGATSPSTPAASAALPAYLRTRLVDVRTGEQFTLAGLGPKLVIVEGMAAW